MSELLTQPQRATPKPVSDKGSGLPPGMVGRGRVSTIYIVVPQILEARISGSPEGARAAGVSRGRETLKSGIVCRSTECGELMQLVEILMAPMERAGARGKRGQPLDVRISVTPSRSSVGPNGSRVKVIMVVWYSGDCCGPLR